MDFFHAAGHKVMLIEVFSIALSISIFHCFVPVLLQVIGFLPDYYLNFERVGEMRRAAKLNIGMFGTEMNANSNNTYCSNST